jgi:hypothetical protein
LSIKAFTRNGEVPRTNAQKRQFERVEIEQQPKPKVTGSAQGFQSHTAKDGPMTPSLAIVGLWNHFPPQCLGFLMGKLRTLMASLNE